MLYYIKKKYKSICNYRLWIGFYLLFLSSIYLNFILFYSFIDSPLFSPFKTIGPTIYTLINSIIFSLPFFIFNVRKAYLFIYILLLDLLLTVNVIYFHYYNNIIPFYSYNNASNLSETTGTLPSYFKISDFIFLLATSCLFLFFLFFRRTNTSQVTLKSRIKILLFLLLFCFFIIGSSYVESKIRHTSWEEKLVNRVEDQPAFASYYGLLPLWTAQIFGHLYSDHQPLTHTESNFLFKFLNRKKNHGDTIGNNNINKNKNLIIIIVESLNTWATKFNNGKATPFLSQLSKDQNIIFIPNVLPQVNHGRSADAQLIINTGLLPVQNNTVTNLYSKQYYPSLIEALKKENNYKTSLTIMGNKATSWNQKTMNIAYHIDTLISIENLDSRERIGMGISDKSLFRQAIKIIDKAKKPFFCQIITLSSHDGENFSNEPSKLQFPDRYTNDIKNYIKSIEYVDNSIKSFIDNLKKQNLYSNSVIIISGDHNGLSSEAIRNITPDILNKNEVKNITFTPLYIINSGFKYKQQSDQVLGEIDIYPSILSIMGLNKYFWRGIGNSIFSSSNPTCAVNVKFNFVGDTTNKSSSNKLKYDAWKVSDIMIRKKVITKISKQHNNERFN